VVLEVCNHRGWELVAVNVRSNHIHVVVSGAEPPERIMSTFKAWATQRMRQAGLLPAEVQPWARHGSTRYLWDVDQVEAACMYVQEAQDEPR
jgi:REP element-mobilizing transposase RayT